MVKCDPLCGQKRPLGREASGVAGEGAVAAYHAVAGHDDGDGIGADGIGHGADGAGLADELRQRSVAESSAVGDSEQRLPHRLLKIGAG